MGRARGPAQPARAHVVAITDLPLFAMLRTRMQWHQERQRLLAENVANADTPNFRPRDLSPLQFDRAQPKFSQVSLDRTETGHIASADGGSSPGRFGGYEARPSGAAVSLEDEMLKVAANQMDFQAATTLYTRSLGLIKTAIGKR
jgi:flagellar basal-body rod protein FlgB